MASELTRTGPRTRRARRAALIGGGVVLAALIGLWAERRPIAAGVIDRELARRGVPARYRIVDLGLGRQRLTDVVIGDPRAPDLVADWIEAETHLGLDGARVTGIRAGRVRARARWVDGRLSLGSLDRLLPASTGKAFALPAIDLDVGDAGVRVDAPGGTLGVRLVGRGRLDGGFRGQIGVRAARYVVGSCEINGARLTAAVSVRAGEPSLDGSAAADRVPCGRPGGVLVQSPGARFAVTLGPHLDAWRGTATQAGAQVVNWTAGSGVDRLYGNVRFAGGVERTEGSFDANTGFAAWRPARGAQATAQGAALRGRFAVGRAGVELAGSVRADGLALDAASRARLAGVARASMGTPLAPLGTRIGTALAQAGESASVTAGLALTTRGGVGRLAVRSGSLTSASGARVTLAGRGVTFDLPSGRVAGSAVLALAGGGLPSARVQAGVTAAGVEGLATVDPYAAGGAVLTFAPARFGIGADGAGRLVTRATLSGPIPGGRVDGLDLPINARWSAAGIVLDPGCGAWSARRVLAGGATLIAPALAVCPLDGALLRIANGRVGGGALVAGVRWTGRMGASPLALTTGAVALRLGARDFSARDVAVRLGPPERMTRLELANLTGSFGRRGPGGSFAGGGGQIGAVPLLLSQAQGKWQVAGGALALTGALTVGDAAAPARFKPLPARDVRLRLAGGRIDGSATLDAPGVARKIADVTIVHTLATGQGQADIAVPGLMFDKALQPDALTPLTFGVIADVAGTITGEGRIAWSDAGVTSSGMFRTAGTDLAAAFGPVEGIAGEIRFVDLLALKSAPDQRLTIKSINPGVPVTDGLVRFAMLSGSEVKVDGGAWPFAGGTLVLRPTLLDYSTPQAHDLTFALSGVDARQFLAQFDFKNMDATGTFDGVLPIRFDQSGGRIENGRLTVREGGGTIAYVGDLGQKDLGFWSNLAFQALKSLRYQRLGIAMNGPLAGEMITDVRFAGVSQGKGAKANFLVRRLERLPFVFNVRIKAPFRGLIDSAQSFYDPSRLIARNLPALIDAEKANAAIQPPASEKRP